MTQPSKLEQLAARLEQLAANTGKMTWVGSAPMTATEALNQAAAALRAAGEVKELRTANIRLRNGYADAVSGYEYILRHHGRLSGVGFDRVQDYFAEWVTIPEREGLLAGSHKLAAKLEDRNDG